MKFVDSRNVVTAQYTQDNHLYKVVGIGKLLKTVTAYNVLTGESLKLKLNTTVWYIIKEEDNQTILSVSHDIGAKVYNVAVDNAELSLEAALVNFGMQNVLEQIDSDPDVIMHDK